MNRKHEPIEEFLGSSRMSPGARGGDRVVRWRDGHDIWNGGGGIELRSPAAILARLAGNHVGRILRTTLVTARLEPAWRSSSKSAWVRTPCYLFTEGVGFEPTSPCGRQFSSSPKHFASGCVWLYMASLRGFFAITPFILLRVVASVCGERCQKRCQNESPATSERWGWPFVWCGGWDYFSTALSNLSEIVCCGRRNTEIVPRVS